MRACIGAMLGALIAGSALARDDTCSVSELVQPEYALPRVAEAIAHKRLDVVVVGTGSSALAGAPGVSKAYPARLEAALARKLPDVAVKVSTYARPRATASEMEHDLEEAVVRDRPALLIWQTGTVDAMRGTEPDEFTAAVGEGVEAAQSAGANVILVNMQYSPRTESMIALGSYVDAMRFVALQREINLFDRLAIMKRWNEAGVFDLSHATRKTDMAERVHDCLGRLMAELIIACAKLTAAGNPDIH